MSEEPIRSDSVPVRPAATVMLLRDSAAGLEVFMLQRSHQSSFARSQYVFPGGRVDADDAAATYEPISDGVTDASVSQRLGIDSGGLAWLVAAIRECFEEAGVLLARRTSEQSIIAFGDESDRFNEARHQIHDGSLRLDEFCRREDLQLLTDRVHLIDHWITPVGERRRFDTRFFVALAPTDQAPLHDNSETIDSLWTTPELALQKQAAGELSMFPPTIASLEWLTGFERADEAVAAASRAPVPEPILPKLIVDENRQVIGVVRNTDADYETTVDPEFIVQPVRKI